MQRLKAAEAMLARYGQENEMLATINEALVSRRAFVDSDYTSTPPTTSCGVGVKSPTSLILTLNFKPAKPYPLSPCIQDRAPGAFWVACKTAWLLQVEVCDMQVLWMRLTG